MRSMRAAVITRQGSPVAPNIELVDMPDPAAGAGEVLIRTEASALNHLDLWIGRGLPGLNTTWPWVGGCDGCGIVEAVGDGVDSAWVGRRVVMNAAVPVADEPSPDAAPAPHDLRMIGEHLHGAHAEKFTAPAANVLDVGEADPGDAAAFALVHLTAWRMLVTRAGLRPGQRVLVTGIGGGVALAALNICRHFGCETVVTSRHQSKLDRAAALGADHGVLDDGEDWSSQVRTLTGKRGVDVCVDSVGKAIHMSCVKSLARGGVFVTCGTTTGHDAVTDLARMFWLQLTFAGSTMGDMDEFRECVALFRSGAMRPEIDRTFPADEAADAYARLESGDQFGKIVIRW
jgi:NADPH:quinone reductase-like Zn-dependent oxidoreductase